MGQVRVKGCAISALLFVSGLAFGAPEPVVLTWSAPVGCPDGDAVKKEIARLLGPNPATAQSVVAKGAITKEGQSYKLVLTTIQAGKAGKREIVDAACAPLADAAALVVALMIDPAAASVAPPVTTVTPVPIPPGPAPISTSPAPPATTTVPEPPPLAPPPPLPPPLDLTPRPKPEPDRPLAIRYALNASVSVAGNILPGSAFGARLGFAVIIERIRLEASGSYFPNHRANVSSHQTAGGTFRFWNAGLFVIGDILYQPTIGFGPCVGFEFGELRATGFGVGTALEGRAVWSAFVSGLRFNFHLGKDAGLHLGVEAVYPFARPEFVIDGVGGVHQPGIVAARAVLGGEVRFP